MKNQFLIDPGLNVIFLYLYQFFFWFCGGFIKNAKTKKKRKNQVPEKYVFFLTLVHFFFFFVLCVFQINIPFINHDSSAIEWIYRSGHPKKKKKNWPHQPPAHTHTRLYPSTLNHIISHFDQTNKKKKKKENCPSKKKKKKWWQQKNMNTKIYTQ